MTFVIPQAEGNDESSEKGPGHLHLEKIHGALLKWLECSKCIEVKNRTSKEIRILYFFEINISHEKVSKLLQYTEILSTY